jgi:hypothetical protein
MGITACEDTFKSKNTYENILTGINKEGSGKWGNIDSAYNCSVVSSCRN